MGVVAGIALVAVIDAGELPERLIAAAAAGGFLLAVALAYPKGMGMGDVKLAAMMGIYLGSAVAPGLLIGFASGSALGLGLIARHGSSLAAWRFRSALSWRSGDPRTARRA